MFYRAYIKRAFAVDDALRSFACGFTIAVSLKIVIMGYNKVCADLDDVSNACLMIGGVALGLIAIDATAKAFKKEDLNRIKNST